MIKNNQISVYDLGLCSYKNAWERQEELLKNVIDQKLSNRGLKEPLITDNYLILVEHPPVITIGKSGDYENLLLSKEQLDELKIEYYKTNRGGDITFHGPGQVVVYPILDLENFFTDIHKYLRFLEEAVILTLSDYGLTAQRSEGETGVWFDVGTPKARKICALGVKSSRWVTMHGFAFNINSDLSYFGNIIPCGITDKSVTSLQKELGKEMDIDQVKNKVKSHLIDLFEMKII